jgi:hypothetical protein
MSESNHEETPKRLSDEEIVSRKREQLRDLLSFLSKKDRQFRKEYSLLIAAFDEVWEGGRSDLFRELGEDP